MAVEPAFHIPLQDSELKALGEISVMQGHIEACMVAAVRHLLDVPIELAREILGSTRVESNARIWRDTIKSKCTDTKITALVETAFADFPTITKGRNDFVHAVFAFQYGDTPGLVPFPDELTPTGTIALSLPQMPRDRLVSAIRELENAGHVQVLPDRSGQPGSVLPTSRLQEQ